VVVEALGVISLLIWLYLLLARGGFWLSAQVPAASPGSDTKLRVVAVIPARDEAAGIGDSVKSLLQQSHSGLLQVIVVDDGSQDGTADAAIKAADSIGAGSRLTILAGAPLRPGWTGKLWAMSQGAAAAAAFEPDYLLFTDADIHHEPGNLAALLANAATHDRDLVSYMVELPVEGLAEKLLIPAFVFFFFQLYPPNWIASPRSRIAGAAGGCMLIRARALAAIGGLEAIRSQLIDDCALARAVKGAGGSIWLGLTHSARSTRRYPSFADIGHMISRTAFNQLRHSYLLLALTLIALGITYALPPILLLTGKASTIALGACAWGLMALCYAPVLRFYRLSPLWGLCLPAIAVFYMAATLHSGLQYLLRRGGHWKGRIQDLRA
jgi:hopene-associated glycosyltransferase HpnB